MSERVLWIVTPVCLWVGGFLIGWSLARWWGCAP